MPCNSCSNVCKEWSHDTGIHSKWQVSGRLARVHGRHNEPFTIMMSWGEKEYLHGNIMFLCFHVTTCTVHESIRFHVFSPFNAHFSSPKWCNGKWSINTCNSPRNDHYACSTVVISLVMHCPALGCIQLHMLIYMYMYMYLDCAIVKVQMQSTTTEFIVYFRIASWLHTLRVGELESVKGA